MTFDIQHLLELYPIVWQVTVVAVIALALNWISRSSKVEPEAMIGVTPAIRPFGSREEYLKARLEMDLETFLDRAHVTPRHITRGPEVFALREPDRVEMVIQNVSGPGFGASAEITGLPGCAGPSGTVGVPSIQSAVNPNPLIDVVQGIPFKVGVYYRYRTGFELLRLAACTYIPGKGWFESKDVKRWLPYSAVELALPRKGESWQIKSCETHGKTSGKIFRQHENRILSLYLTSALLCGCLAPFEFGTGNVSGEGKVL